MHSKYAFSLVELMVAVGIVGILATLAIPRYHAFMVQARRGEAKSNLHQIATLQEAYRAEHSTYYSGAAMRGSEGIGYKDKYGNPGDCDDYSDARDEGLSNRLGFRPKACDELRYFYQLITADVVVAFAYSDANRRHIYPDCDGQGCEECGYEQGDAVRLALGDANPVVCRNITKHCPEGVGGILPPPPPPPPPCSCSWITGLWTPAINLASECSCENFIQTRSVTWNCTGTPPCPPADITTKPTPSQTVTGTNTTSSSCIALCLGCTNLNTITVPDVSLLCPDVLSTVTTTTERTPNPPCTDLVSTQLNVPGTKGESKQAACAKSTSGYVSGTWSAPNCSCPGSTTWGYDSSTCIGGCACPANADSNCPSNASSTTHDWNASTCTCTLKPTCNDADANKCCSNATTEVTTCTKIPTDAWVFDASESYVAGEGCCRSTTTPPTCDDTTQCCDTDPDPDTVVSFPPTLSGQCDQNNWKGTCSGSDCPTASSGCCNTPPLCKTSTVSNYCCNSSGTVGLKSAITCDSTKTLTSTASSCSCTTAPLCNTATQCCYGNIPIANTFGLTCDEWKGTYVDTNTITYGCCTTSCDESTECCWNNAPVTGIEPSSCTETWTGVATNASGDGCCTTTTTPPTCDDTTQCEKLECESNASSPTWEGLPGCKCSCTTEGFTWQYPSPPPGLSLTSTVHSLLDTVANALGLTDVCSEQGACVCESSTQCCDGNVIMYQSDCVSTPANEYVVWDETKKPDCCVDCGCTLEYPNFCKGETQDMSPAVTCADTTTTSPLCLGKISALMGRIRSITGTVGETELEGKQRVCQEGVAPGMWMGTVCQCPSGYTFVYDGYTRVDADGKLVCLADGRCAASNCGIDECCNTGTTPSIPVPYSSLTSAVQALCDPNNWQGTCTTSCTTASSGCCTPPCTLHQVLHEGTCKYEEAIYVQCFTQDVITYAGVDYENILYLPINSVDLGLDHLWKKTCLDNDNNGGV